MVIDERDLAIALEHPRGTERRTLLPFREALNDVALYARLPVADRDAIVRWVEVRRRLAEDHGLDHDPANLAAGIATSADGGGDLRALVSAIRGG